VPGAPSDDPKTNGCPSAAAPAEKVIFPEQVPFAPDATTVSAEAATALAAVAKQLGEHPELRVRIEGHADDAEAKNGDVKKLTTDRAEAARAWLVQHGIDAARLRVEGYGAERLIDTSGTEVGRSRNRRVEVHAIEEAADQPVK
jgi:outer membrane protein OmpA-like peptidoglycan-associated protein